MDRYLGTGAYGTQPEGIDIEVVVEEVKELTCLSTWDGEVLDNEVMVVSHSVEVLVHFARVHEGVEEEACETIKRESVEGVGSHPERTAVISEEIVFNGDRLKSRIGKGRGGGFVRGV